MQEPIVELYINITQTIMAITIDVTVTWTVTAICAWPVSLCSVICTRLEIFHTLVL